MSQSPLLNLDFNAIEVLDSLPDGAYITDRERNILFWNRAAERITGWTKTEVMNRTCHDNLLVHVNKDGQPLCGHEHCPLHRSIITNQPSEEAMLVFAMNKSASRTPVEVTVAPIRNHAGEVVGGIEMFRDLTVAMQDQLRAKKVQAVSMRCELPNDDRVSIETRYLPHDLVGGDFYRIEQLEAARYAVLLADAAGHGVSAALCTILLRSLWEHHHAKLAVPGEFMQAINKGVRSVMEESGYFGTGVFVNYEAPTGQLRCVLAGHERQLLFRAGGPVEPIGDFNSLLGLLDEVTYRETLTQVQPGDTLLLFTDGATEVVNSAGQVLGVAGLERLVREQTHGVSGADFSLEKLTDQLLGFCNQLHLPDDLTLVKIRRLH